MSTIIGIAGSLRSASLNAKLLSAAATLAPDDCDVEIATIRGIPLYDGDVEAAGTPEAVQRLKDRIAVADGLLIATPEYNHSIPGVLKNAIDWLSRPGPTKQRVFADLPVAIMGATPGRAGTLLAQNAWLPVLRALGTRPWFGQRLIVSGAGHVFDEAGALVDERLRDEVGRFMNGFAAFVRGQPPA